MSCPTPAHRCFEEGWNHGREEVMEDLRAKGIASHTA
jgi:hypothetical protein